MSPCTCCTSPLSFCHNQRNHTQQIKARPMEGPSKTERTQHNMGGRSNAIESVPKDHSDTTVRSRFYLHPKQPMHAPRFSINIISCPGRHSLIHRLVRGLGPVPSCFRDTAFEGATATEFRFTKKRLVSLEIFEKRLSLITLSPP